MSCSLQHCSEEHTFVLKEFSLRITAWDSVIGYSAIYQGDRMRHITWNTCNAVTAGFSPVLGGARAPHSSAEQCMCSGVYFSARSRPLASSVAKTGTLWKRRQPVWERYDVCSSRHDDL